LPTFGFAHSPFGLVVKKCREALGPNSVQVITNRDTLVRRRCYVVLGSDTLDSVRVRLLNRSNSVLVVVDALPALKNIVGIQILDSLPGTDIWNPIKPRFAQLLQALRSKPKPLKFGIAKDQTVSRMITSIKERSVLDSVLSAAKMMDSANRALLHVDVAQVLVGKTSMASFKRRCESRGASGRLYERMLGRLSDPTAKRLSVALKQARAGEDVVLLAAKYQVDASELRFLLAKLKVK
jgi:hypothetical protein